MHELLMRGINSTLEQAGISACLRPRMLATSWLAVAFLVGSTLSWIVERCCYCCPYRCKFWQSKAVCGRGAHLRPSPCNRDEDPPEAAYIKALSDCPSCVLMCLYGFIFSLARKPQSEPLSVQAATVSCRHFCLMDVTSSCIPHRNAHAHFFLSFLVFFFSQRRQYKCITKHFFCSGIMLSRS